MSETGRQEEDREVTSYEEFKAAGGQSYGLRVGSEIKFLSEMPVYKVTEVDTPPKTPRINIVRQSEKSEYTYYDGDKKEHVTTHLPDNLTMAGTKKFGIGRQSTDCMSLPVSAVSRVHVTMHFDNRSNRFVMKAVNSNPGYIRNAARIGLLQTTNLAQGGDTLVDFRAPKKEGEEEIKAETEVLLRPGMTVKLLPDAHNVVTVPTYQVKTAVSGVKPQLELEMIGDTMRYSAAATRVKLEGKDASRNIGSLEDPAIVSVNHPLISRFHASLYYDTNQNSWIYNTVQQPPVVGVGNQFLADMGDVGRRVAGTKPDDARNEITEIDALIDDMQKDRDGRKNVLELMKKVQGLEMATIDTKPEDRERGGRTVDSQRGYRNWLHAYKLLYKEDIAAVDMAGLDKAMKAMNTMEQDRIVLEDIESYSTGMFPKLTKSEPYEILKAVRKTGYNKDMSELVERQVAPLNSKPPESSVVVSGFRGHHTVTKIDKDSKGYLVTTYNTGAELKYADDGENALSKYSRHLNKSVKIEDFVRLLDERKVRHQAQGDSDKIHNAIESSLGKIEVSEVAPPQHKGNCTTRSTREMLKDMIAPERFAHLHRHVSNPDVCDPADILAALQMRRDALAAIAPVVRPKTQVDWAQSVSDYRASDASHAGAGSMHSSLPGGFADRF